MIGVIVESRKDNLELVQMEAEEEFGRGLRKVTMTPVGSARPDGAVLELIFDESLERIRGWVEEQASYDYSGDGMAWRLYDGSRRIRLARHGVDHFEYEGTPYRVRGLGPDSGVRAMGRLNTEKWVLEYQVGNRWIGDGAVYLPNGSSPADARKRFNV